jgi:hypothetical protein
MHAQPLSASEQPTFIEMLEIASRAKDGIVIPTQKACRVEIINIFCEFIVDLRGRFFVCVSPSINSASHHCLVCHRPGFFNL